jgi:hypothetical protein
VAAAALCPWVVERTCAWQGQNRRLSKDDERLCAAREALVYVARSTRPQQSIILSAYTFRSARKEMPPFLMKT